MNKSESIANLSKALVEFSLEAMNPINSAVNPFFKNKYAPLSDILEVNRPLLAKHGLVMATPPASDNGQKVSINGILIHSSGEFIEFDPFFLTPVKGDPQSIGSAVTYGRRYFVAAVLGLASEDDDDGNAASNLQKKQNNKVTKLHITGDYKNTPFPKGKHAGKTLNEIAKIDKNFIEFVANKWTDEGFRKAAQEILAQL